MNLGLSRCALTIGAAAVILAGCGGSQNQALGLRGMVSQGADLAGRGDGKSALLYVATYEDTFFIVNYSSGNVKQEALPGESFGGGACSGSDGNVFITGYEDAPSPGGQIFEYQHGGTTPSNVLTDGSTWAPNACSVDPTTGNLAVSNNSDAGGGHPQAENISVYPGAVGPPTTYTDPAFEHYDDVAYDNAGNLYVVGNGPSPSYQFELAELPNGSSTFMNISLPSQVNGNHVQWDGQYLAVGKPTANHKSPVIYRVQVSGSAGTLVQAVTFRGNWASAKSSGEVFRVQGNEITLGYRGGSLGVWKYPSGGRVKQIFKGMPFQKAGLAISTD